jgi:hypothetical protein
MYRHLDTQPSKRHEPWLDYDLIDREGEEWRDVTGYDGIYQVSNHGRIKSLSRYDCRGNKLPATIRRPVLRQAGSSVQLFEERVGVSYSIMRLVAAAFLAPKPANHVWLHSNKNGNDNRLCNIQAATPRESKLLNHRLGIMNLSPVGGNNSSLRRESHDQEFGIFQDGEMVAQVCHICRQQRTLTEFGHNGPDKKYLNRVCSDCRKLDRQAKKKDKVSAAPSEMKGGAHE